MSTLKWTGERLVTAVDDETVTEHLHRYKFALDFCKGKSVIDIACGEGYGSALLAGIAGDVTGVDIDDAVIKFANEKYSKSNLRYLHGNASAIPCPDASTDVVVSFETIEHHDQHQEMMKEIKRVLKPEGILIISTPERKYYSEERNYKNPFHVKELNRDEFQALLGQYFKNCKLLGQRLVYGSLLVDAENEKSEFEFYNGDFSRVNITPMKPYYYIAIASDAPVPSIKSSFFDSEEILSRRFTDIFSSPSFRLGNFLLRPAAAVMRLLGLKK
jgi:ubiquinone/menaquinone biosynthesis C-methylase UbiE